MEIAPINVLAFTTGAVCFLIVLVSRLITKRAHLDTNVYWAAMSALSGWGVVKAAYPFYRVWRYHTLTGIEDLPLYIMVGGVVGFGAGMYGLYHALKS